MDRDARDREQRELRGKMLELPTVRLRRLAFLNPASRAIYGVKPTKVSIGPAGEPVALWQSRTEPDRQQVTTHEADGGIRAAVDLSTDLTIRHIQPLPDGEILLVSTESPADGATALVVDADGATRRTARWGRAIGEVLASPSGRIWVGHWDESQGEEFTGLVCFDLALEPRWRSGDHRELPALLDCYALNVSGENAYCVGLSSDQACVLTSSDGAAARYVGRAPVATPTRLLIDGDTGAVAGSWQPALYDVVTPFRLVEGGVAAGGPTCRIVLPNGLDAARMRWTCRGPDLHAFDSDGTWYRLALSDLPATS